MFCRRTVMGKIYEPVDIINIVLYLICLQYIFNNYFSFHLNLLFYFNFVFGSLSPPYSSPFIIVLIGCGLYFRRMCTICVNLNMNVLCSGV